MPASISRSVACLAAMILLVLLVGGCAGRPDASTTAAKATSTVAPTTTAPPPLTTKERAWLKAVPRVSGKIEKTVGVEGFYVTTERLHSFANTLRSCRRELLGAGAPSGRLRPAYALVNKACAQQDKGARCFDTAATFHPLGEGTPAARAQDRAIDCGFDKATKGLSLLADAEEEGSTIEDEAG